MSGLRAEWELVSSDERRIIIRDVGHRRAKSVTNDVANVVADLLPALRGRRLFYFDSDEQLDEILVRDGKFAGFAPVAPEIAVGPGDRL